MGKMGFGGFSKPSLFGGRGHDRGQDDRSHDNRGHDGDDDRHGHHARGDDDHHGGHDRSCDTDGPRGHDNTHGHSGSDHTNGGGVNAGGNAFPGIPKDTTGVTFHIDLNGDGVMDEYVVVQAPRGVDPATLTMQDYYDAVGADVKANHPDIPPNQIIVKATIYSATTGESYQYFDGTETMTEDQTPVPCDDDDTKDDSHHGGPHGGDHGGHGGDNDHGDHGIGSHETGCAPGDRDDDNNHADNSDVADDGIGSHETGCAPGDRDDDTDHADNSDDDADDGIGSHETGCAPGDSHASGNDGAGHGGDHGDSYYTKLMACGDVPSEDDHGSHDDEQQDASVDDLILC